MEFNGENRSCSRSVVDDHGPRQFYRNGKMDKLRRAQMCETSRFCLDSLKIVTAGVSVPTGICDCARRYFSWYATRAEWQPLKVAFH